MAENKKSFILYCDYQQVFNTLTDKEAGQLIKHILGYVNDENPVLENRVLKIAFEPIKLQLKRDLSRWDDFKKRQADNGKKGGRPKTQTNPENPSLILANPEKPNLTQKSLTVTATVTKKKNREKEIPPLEIFMAYAKEKKPNVNEEQVKFKYQAWVENDWHTGKDKPILNWKSTLSNTLAFLGESSNGKRQMVH